jgi:hypothetical protein
MKAIGLVEGLLVKLRIIKGDHYYIPIIGFTILFKQTGYKRMVRTVEKKTNA